MAKKRRTSNIDFLPTRDEVNVFDMLFPMIQSDLHEIRELSKKKQDEPLNIFKVKMINKKLEKAKSILRNEETTVFLDLLDEETMPTNSDAVLQISQYINAMENFRGKYYESDGSLLGLEDFDTYEWKTKD